MIRYAGTLRALLEDPNFSGWARRKSKSLRKEIAEACAMIRQVDIQIAKLEKSTPGVARQGSSFLLAQITNICKQSDPNQLGTLMLLCTSCYILQHLQGRQRILSSSTCVVARGCGAAFYISHSNGKGLLRFCIHITRFAFHSARSFPLNIRHTASRKLILIF